MTVYTTLYILTEGINALNEGVLELSWVTRQAQVSILSSFLGSQIFASKKSVFSDLLFLQEEKIVEKDSTLWKLDGEPTVLVTVAHIFNHFAPLMVCTDNIWITATNNAA